MSQNHNNLLQAHAAKLRGDFMAAALPCGGFAMEVQGDLSTRELAEIRKTASDLVSVLNAMLARTAEGAAR